MKLKLVILVLAAQCAWLLAITAVQERALTVGKVILLQTAPVDPRDLLAGDYLTLHYKISTVPRNLFAPPLPAGNPPPGGEVFVALTEGPDHFYTIKRASTEEFVPASDEVLLRGHVSQNWWNTTGGIRLDYGIERFYVAEGTGQPKGVLTAEVAVPSSRHGIIKDVLVDGQPYADAMKTSVNKH